MRLNLYSLQLFVAVVEEGTIAAAAEREHIATSALSKRISELERVIGTPLLIRRARGVAATAEGQALARGARALLHKAEDLAGEVRDFASGVSGHVRIAANLSSITQFLPGDLQRFMVAHPKVGIDLEERISTAVTRMVLDNQADIGIFARSDDVQGLDIFPYRCDCMAMLVPVGHPLAVHASVAFADTLDYGHVAMHRGSAANNMLARAAADLNRSMSTRFHVTSYDAMVSMVQAGLGIGVVPRDAIARLYAREGFALVELSDAWAQRQLQLCVRSGDGLTAAARLLLQALRTPAPPVG